MRISQDKLNSTANLIPTFLGRTLGGEWVREHSNVPTLQWISVVDGNSYRLQLGTFWAETTYRGQDGVVTSIRIPYKQCENPECVIGEGLCISKTVETLLLKSPEFAELARNELMCHVLSEARKHYSPAHESSIDLLTKFIDLVSGNS